MARQDKRADLVVILAVTLEFDAHPKRVKQPFALNPQRCALRKNQLVIAHGERFITPPIAIIEPKTEIEQRHVNAEEAENRPRAECPKIGANSQGNPAEQDHQPKKAARRQRHVRPQYEVKIDRQGLRLIGLTVLVHDAISMPLPGNGKLPECRGGLKKGLAALFMGG